MVAQEGGDQPGVEMQRIGDRAPGHCPSGEEGELAVIGQRDRGAQIGEGLAMPAARFMQ